MNAYEVNFDGLVGASHNYAGLSSGNIASETHKDIVSSPKKAALQGLEKMKFLHDLGLKQGILVPHFRPAVNILRELGYEGSDEKILRTVYQQKPELFASISSASAMWTANAATVSPSADTSDSRVHFTAANLSSKFHRSIEAKFSSKILQRIFSDEKFFSHHQPLNNEPGLGDEGAANHTRLCSSYSEPGIEIFTYGKDGMKYKARQGFKASKTIALDYHGLKDFSVVFTEQNPEVIDAGVFHNDVISVGNQNVFLYHEKAFSDTESAIDEIQEKYFKLSNSDLYFLKIKDEMLSVTEAVESYLFNSQIIESADGEMSIIAPAECQVNSSVQDCLKEILAANNPIKQIHYMDLKQSMQNGGGPACLRLRVVLNSKELDAMHQAVLFTDERYLQLKNWVNKYYRDELRLKDICDPLFSDEVRRGLEELESILDLKGLYAS